MIAIELVMTPLRDPERMRLPRMSAIRRSGKTFFVRMKRPIPGGRKMIDSIPMEFGFPNTPRKRRAYHAVLPTTALSTPAMNMIAAAIRMLSDTSVAPTMSASNHTGQNTAAYNSTAEIVLPIVSGGITEYKVDAAANAMNAPNTP